MNNLARFIVTGLLLGLVNGDLAPIIGLIFNQFFFSFWDLFIYFFVKYRDMMLVVRMISSRNAIFNVQMEIIYLMKMDVQHVHAHQLVQK